MGSNDALDIVLLQKFLSQISPKVNRTLPGVISPNNFAHVPILNLDRISPYKVAKSSVQRDFFIPLYFIYFLNLKLTSAYFHHLVRDSPVDAEKAFVDEAG